LEDFSAAYECSDGRCIRRTFDYDSKELLGFVLVLMMTMINNAGGLGGGGQIIPIFIYMFDFATIESIPLSKITMFAGAVTIFCMTFRERYSKDKSVLVTDIGATAIVTPLVVAGSQTGVALSKFCPPLFVMIGLSGYLIHSSRQMYANAKSAFAKETERLKAHADLLIEERGDAQTQPMKQAFEVEAAASPVLPTLGQLYRENLPNFLYLACSVSVVILTAFLRGTEGIKSIVGIERCSFAGTAIFVLSQLLNAGISYTAYRDNMGRSKPPTIFSSISKSSVESQMRDMITTSYIGGIGSGLFGLGGGLILGMHLMSVGVPPELTTALTGFNLLWVSSSTSMQYALIGALHVRHAGPLMVVSLVGSLMGQLILKQLIKKYQRPSLIIWVVFVGRVIAAIVLPIEAFYRLYENPSNSLAIGSLC
jgi:uncharacterized membrane protein YfcA